MIGSPASVYVHVGKRLLDAVSAVLLLMALGPLLLMLAIAVRFIIGPPILFRQVRPGLRGQPFTIFKFRTMTDARDMRGNLLPDEERLPPFGRWLRSTSADEIPELWNVIKGDMSLVGPRPLLMEYLPRYSSRQARRHDVRPGITGLAQVSGRNELPWDARLELDAQYVERVSLALDLTLMWRTTGLVLARRGIRQPGHATVDEFMGSKKAADGP